MPLAQKPVLLVGSAPGENATEVFESFGADLGDVALAYPDGETGLRRGWVIYLVFIRYIPHPDLELSFEPPGGKPTGYEDLHRFRVREGCKRIVFDKLGYADEAKASYALFKQMRDENKIPAGVRFQVCFPLPEDAVRIFSETKADYEMIAAGYSDALEKEITEVVNHVPADDLLIQFDINWEVLAVAADDHTGKRPLSFALSGTPMDRYVSYLSRFAAFIPSEIKLGLHLCYGDLAHRHYFEPSDLGVTVDMANRAVTALNRPVDYVHMPVPRTRTRTDDAYFDPLDRLDLGNGTLYAGLLHLTDGLEGALSRVEVLQRHYQGHFGVATECGIGHRPPGHTMADLLSLHREVAQALRSNSASLQ